MKAASREHRNRWTTRTLLIVVLTVGVALMHSAMPLPATMTDDAPAAATHHTQPSETDALPAGHVNPVAADAQHCPSAHMTMHPCIGTVTVWPHTVPPLDEALIEHADTLHIDTEAEHLPYLGRAPPWTLWKLDRSVTLRV